MDARRSRGPRGRSGGQAGGEGAFIYYLGRGLGDLFCRAVDQRGQGAQGWRASHRHFVNEEVITQPVRRKSATI